MDRGPFSCLNWALDQQGLKLTWITKPNMRCLDCTQQWDAFIFSKSRFLKNINLLSVDTGISHPLFLATLKSTSLTSFWKLWVSLIGAYMTALCAAMSCQQASWMTVTSWTTTDARPDHLKKQQQKKQRQATATHSCWHCECESLSVASRRKTFLLYDTAQCS